MSGSPLLAESPHSKEETRNSGVAIGFDEERRNFVFRHGRQAFWTKAYLKVCLGQEAQTDKA